MLRKARERVIELRRRMISTEFWCDEKVASLSHFERLMFIGLWALADDRGVAEFSAHLIKSQLFGTDEEVSRAHCLDGLMHLVELGLVRTFTAPPPPPERKNGHRAGATSTSKRWLYIPRFLDYQRISHPASSLYPMPNPEQFEDLEAAEDYGNLPQVAESFRDLPQSAPQVKLREVKLKNQHQEQERCDFESAHADSAHAEQVQEQVQPPALSPANGENASPNSAALEVSSPVNGNLAGEGDRENGGKTVALNQGETPLARETLIAFTEHILRRIALPRSPAVLAVIADALVKCRTERGCTWRDAHNELYTCAAVALHDGPPADWIDWFRQGSWRRVRGDPPTQDTSSIVPTGEHT
jgi:hypothetical protein